MVLKGLAIKLGLVSSLIYSSLGSAENHLSISYSILPLDYYKYTYEFCEGISNCQLYVYDDYGVEKIFEPNDREAYFDEKVKNAVQLRQKLKDLVTPRVEGDWGKVSFKGKLYTGENGDIEGEFFIRYKRRF